MSVFLITLVTYWLTVPPTVSYWDCPEYVAAAWRLEVGHPPGNPFWMLVERIVTMFVSADKAALAVNMSSGFFMALAVGLLSRVIFAGARWVLKGVDGCRRRIHALYAGGAAAIGSLAFGWCDSAWYSAVEAEVYAMSTFLTILSVWLMVRWATSSNPSLGWRYLALLAYVFGLSLGVHQLNLLCVPALAMIWAARRGISSAWKYIAIFVISLVAVGCVLEGMMPSTIALASEFELLAVNDLHLPFLSGVVIYVLLLGVALLVALGVTARSTNRGVLALSIFPAIFLSGIFVIGHNYIIGITVSLLASLIMVKGSHFQPRRLNMAMWMLAMLLTGYSSYALIPIRGGVAAPQNNIVPDDPFSFAAYQAREQYGKKPLVYGETPYSRLMFQEEYDAQGVPVYHKYLFDTGRPVMERRLVGARLRHASVGMTPDDSLLNVRALSRQDDAYLVKGHTNRNVLTPELNMWFPRITSRTPDDIVSYANWVGMDTGNMVEVEISEARDSAGRYVARMDENGRRVKQKSRRPTYMQNLQYFLGYQVGYMYLRYLMWNFSGRQNDIPTNGEVEHGNFITGFRAIDNLMLQAEHRLPEYAGDGNPGRNRYYMLPLLLGIWGIVWMMRGGKRGRMGCGVVALLFIMTGVAITVYLNQDPGQPRERDYTFLGSYMAYCIWIGAGALALARTVVNIALRVRKKIAPRQEVVYASVGFVIALGVPLLMVGENIDDHNRSGRAVASTLSANILNSLEHNAILFVDGDNMTFPLWYAQEVEGIRRDVRVINLSYLTAANYAAGVLRAWEDSPAIGGVLREEDLIYNAFLRVMIGAEGTDDAVAALQRLQASKDASFDVASVRLRLPVGDSVTLPLKNLSRSGDGNRAEFRKLMILDIVAAATGGDKPRPVYWLRNLNSAFQLGLTPYLSESLYAFKLGGEGTESEDSAAMESEKYLRFPNERSDAYMDDTPAHQLAYQKAAVTMAAMRALRRGDKARSRRLADFLLIGDAGQMNTYIGVRNADTTYRTGYEIVKMLRELSDSMELRGYASQADALEAKLDKRKADWEAYREALTPAMRRNCVSR